MPSAQPVLHTIQTGEDLYTIAQRYQTTIPAILSQNDHMHPSEMIPGVTIHIAPTTVEHAHCSPCPNPPTPPAETLHDEMREAWEQHIYWTRMVLLSVVHRLPDQSVTARRLLQNPADLANLFGRYYPGAKDDIQRLLTEHIEIGGKYITALRDGDTTQAQNLQVAWYRNADQMAALFSSINPHYRLEMTRKMLYKHLALTTKEIKDRVAGHYALDIADFDEVEHAVLAMADYFTDGIARRSPGCP